MRLILFRHGIAEDQHPGLPDADRRLTPEGITRTRKAARGLVTLIGRPDTILTSPKRRAAETADLLAEAAGITPATLDALAEGPIDAVLQSLPSRDDEQTVVLVGHEPMFSTLAERLCVDDTPSFIELKKAGAVVLRIHSIEPNMSATLEALLPPKALRALASGRPA